MSLIKQIQDYILSEGLAPGDSMPSETELAQMFGASRGMVREALQYFRMHGMIDSKPRRGMHIKSFLPENPFEAYLPFCMSNEDLLKINEMRFVLESGLASMLIERATCEQLDELERIALAMGKATYRELEALDTEFHKLLISTGGNKFINCLIPFTVEYFHRVFAVEENPDQTLASYRDNESQKHLEIVEAIRSKSAEKFRALLEHHYNLLKK
jgi:DNA-binding FadR family transcriptional regulator